jgi:hypothetical protein
MHMTEKSVGRLQDGETFNDAVATVGDYPDISPINYIFSNDYHMLILLQILAQTLNTK